MLGQQQSSPHSVDYASFDPTTMYMLQQVIDDAWQELVRRGDPVADAGREQIVRELMAHRVMARATRGDIDPARLMNHALWGFSIEGRLADRVAQYRRQINLMNSDGRSADAAQLALVDALEEVFRQRLLGGPNVESAAGDGAFPPH